jgi:hypothetical protein
MIPETLNLGSTPKPVNRSLHLEDVTPRKVGSVKINDNISLKVIQESSLDLEDWMRNQKLNIGSEAVYVCLNPWSPVPFLKTHEIHIDVA